MLTVMSREKQPTTQAHALPEFPRPSLFRWGSVQDQSTAARTVSLLVVHLNKLQHIVAADIGHVVPIKLELWISAFHKEHRGLFALR